MFLGVIFQIQTKPLNGWPDLTQPEPQKIDLDPSLHDRVLFDFSKQVFPEYTFPKHISSQKTLGARLG